MGKLLPSSRYCELCERSDVRLTVHHLRPRQYSRRKKLDPGPTAEVCSPCHRQIHALFSNRQLAEEFNTIAALQSHPDMQKFLAWIRKQDPQRHIRVHRGR